MNVEEKKKGESSRDYALRVLRSNIVDRKLEPGSLVSEKDLAIELGLSRTPVREALIELSRVGVLEAKPQVGYQISPISYRLVEEVQFTRKALECAVIERACQVQNPEYMEKIEENLNLQLFYLKRADKDRLFALDQEFHRLFFEMTDRMISYQLLDMIGIPFERVRKMSLDYDENFSGPKDHMEIFKYVKAKDEEHARLAMEEHLSRYKIDEAMVLDRYPASYFSDF